jgi:hypothetical protein
MEIKKLKPNSSTIKKNQKKENIDLDTGYKYKIIWISLIAIIGSAIFFQTFNYNFSGDDGLYSFSNKATQKGLKDVVDIFRFGSLNFIAHNPTNTGTYRPVTLLTFSVEKQLFGEFRPSTGHIINIILYFLTLLLIGLFLESIFKI